MSEPIEEYATVQLSKTTLDHLKGLAEFIEPSMPSPTIDMVIARMLQNLDFLTDGDNALIYDLDEDYFDFIPRTDDQFFSHIRKKTAEHEKLKTSKQGKASRKKQEAEGK